MDDFEDLFYPELESLEDEDDCENTCTCPGCLSLHKPSDTEATLSDEEQKFAVKCVADLLEYEIEHIAPLFASPPDELSQAHLTSFNFEDFIKKVSAETPHTWLCYILMCPRTLGTRLVLACVFECISM
ncbi:hypothetical protein EDB19DRAFT_2041367 [Suillus lakei]|nr:hypothetical protein EDB19DRAFT_2041367 [Suillus lakei]